MRRAPVLTQPSYRSLTRAFMVLCGARRAATPSERAQLGQEAVADRVRRGAVPERQRLGIVGFAPDERSTRLAGRRRVLPPHPAAALPEANGHVGLQDSGRTADERPTPAPLHSGRRVGPGWHDRVY